MKGILNIIGISIDNIIYRLTDLSDKNSGADFVRQLLRWHLTISDSARDICMQLEVFHAQRGTTCDQLLQDTVGLCLRINKKS